jgi:hypothetical protein
VSAAFRADGDPTLDPSCEESSFDRVARRAAFAVSTGFERRAGAGLAVATTCWPLVVCSSARTVGSELGTP